MAFDFGQMMEQMMGGNRKRNGGEQAGKDSAAAVYDVVVVGYGPAGGVMVSFAAHFTYIRRILLSSRYSKHSSCALS